MAEATSEKRKALDAALTGIRKQFGEGSIMKLGECEDEYRRDSNRVDEP